jgi:hypothetical protein
VRVWGRVDNVWTGGRDALVLAPLAGKRANPSDWDTASEGWCRGGGCGDRSVRREGIPWPRPCFRSHPQSTEVNWVWGCSGEPALVALVEMGSPPQRRTPMHWLQRAVKEVKRATAVVVQTGPFLGDMVVDGPFRDRFLELAGKGLARTLQALAAGAAGNAASKELLVGKALARWFVDAGGNFPKLAQVRLIHTSTGG